MVYLARTETLNSKTVIHRFLSGLSLRWTHVDPLCCANNILKSIHVVRRNSKSTFIKTLTLKSLEIKNGVPLYVDIIDLCCL